MLNVGLACQYQSYELVEMDEPEFQEFIQDALDLVEFANGAVDTKWGALRAQMGHPEPFGMTMMGIGNEQWKMMPPLFLCFATHPMTVTVSPTLAAESSPHLWVLFRPFIDSAMSAPFAARGGPSYPLISLILSNSFPASPGKEFGMSFISAVLCKTPEIPPSPPS